MAIDTREERQSTIGLLLYQLPAGVDPTVAGFPRSSRQASIRVYAGIGSGAAAALALLRAVPANDRARTVATTAMRAVAAGKHVI